MIRAEKQFQVLFKPSAEDDAAQLTPPRPRAARQGRTRGDDGREERKGASGGDERGEEEMFPSACPVANLISLASATEQIRLLCAGDKHTLVLC